MTTTSWPRRQVVTRPASSDRLLSVRRSVTRRLWSSPRRPLGEVVASQRRSYDRAVYLVQAFYAASLVWVVMETNGWPTLLRVDRADPLWPAAWLDLVDLHRGIQVILAGHLLAALVVVAQPRWRAARIAYCFSLLQYMALIYAFGKINHNLYAWLFTSAVLVLLPSGPWTGRRSISERHHFLTVLWSAQVLVLFFYTLTGLWKVAYACKELIGPGVSGFELRGFSAIVAQRLLDTNQTTILGEFFVHNQLVGWALFNATMYLEVTSLLIAFRPRLYRAWGVGLLLFHLGTQLAMGFTFVQNLLLIGLLLVFAPAAPESVTLREAVSDLPGLHGLARRRRRRAVRQVGRRAVGARPAA